MQRALVWSAFGVGYLAAYFISTAVPLPLVWHLPLERRFTYEVRPLALGADYYGRLLFSLACGAALALGALGGLRLVKAEPRPQWLRAHLFWMGGLIAFTAGLYLHVLASRQPIPAPLPPGYVAR